jgi:hypothetical protein
LVGYSGYLKALRTRGPFSVAIGFSKVSLVRWGPC